MYRSALILLILTFPSSWSKTLSVLNPELDRTGWDLTPNVDLTPTARDLSRRHPAICDLQPKVGSLGGRGLWVFPPNTYSKMQLQYQMTQARSALVRLRCYKFGPDKFMVRPLRDDGTLNCTIPESKDVCWYGTLHQVSVHELLIEGIFGPRSFAICDTIEVIQRDNKPKPVSSICTAQITNSVSLLQ